DLRFGGGQRGGHHHGPAGGGVGSAAGCGRAQRRRRPGGGRPGRGLARRRGHGGGRHRLGPGVRHAGDAAAAVGGPGRMILDRIIAETKAVTARRRRMTPLRALAEAEQAAPPPRSLAGRLRAVGAVSLLAEVKRKSPSKGVLRADFDPAALARAYAKAGADAISVLTDGPFFGGGLDHLRAVREAVPLPVLRKDFIVDPYQVAEARAA